MAAASPAANPLAILGLRKPVLYYQIKFPWQAKQTTITSYSAILLFSFTF